jgi:hypothetical protein
MKIRKISIKEEKIKPGQRHKNPRPTTKDIEEWAKWAWNKGVEEGTIDKLELPLKQFIDLHLNKHLRRTIPVAQGGEPQKSRSGRTDWNRALPAHLKPKTDASAEEKQMASLFALGHDSWNYIEDFGGLKPLGPALGLTSLDTTPLERRTGGEEEFLAAGPTYEPKGGKYAKYSDVAVSDSEELNTPEAEKAFGLWFGFMERFITSIVQLLKDEQMSWYDDKAGLNQFFERTEEIYGDLGGWTMFLAFLPEPYASILSEPHLPRALLIPIAEMLDDTPLWPENVHKVTQEESLWAKEYIKRLAAASVIWHIAVALGIRSASLVLRSMGYVVRNPIKSLGLSAVPGDQSIQSIQSIGAGEQEL